MKLSVEIADSVLDGAVQKGIEGLINETITQIAKDAISSYLSDPKVMEKILFKERQYYSSGPELRNEIVRILENSFTADEVEKYRKMLFAAVEQRGEDIMIKTLASIFSNMLMTEPAKVDLQVQLAQLATKIETHN